MICLFLIILELLHLALLICLFISLSANLYAEENRAWFVQIRFESLGEKVRRVMGCGIESRTRAMMLVMMMVVVGWFVVAADSTTATPSMGMTMSIPIRSFLKREDGVNVN